MTNHEKIKSSSAVELAKMIAKYAECKFCPARRQFCEATKISCAQAWCNWLFDEVEE